MQRTPYQQVRLGPRPAATRVGTDALVCPAGQSPARSRCRCQQCLPRDRQLNPHQFVQVRGCHALLDETEAPFFFHFANSVEQPGHRRTVQ